MERGGVFNFFPEHAIHDIAGKSFKVSDVPDHMNRVLIDAAEIGELGPGEKEILGPMILKETVQFFAVFDGIDGSFRFASPEDLAS